MKKTLQRYFCLFIAIIMMVTALAACGGKASDVKPTVSTTQEATTAKVEEPIQEGLPRNGIKYEPEVTIQTARDIGADVKFKNDETIENNVHTKWAKEKLGINIKYLWTTPATNDAYYTKLKLSMTANEPLPDFISLPGNLAHEMIESGKFQPVGELFDKYASQEWKNAMEEVPNAWMPYVRDGKKYAIPGIDYTMQHDDSMWIRQDWLEKLGLEAPKTIEELEKVMDAFVNLDPDGNKKKDTFGMTVAMMSGDLINYYNNWIGPGAIFGSFGAVPQIWQKDGSGEIVYGSIRPEIKPALAKLKDWVDKGYLHKEVGLMDEMKASQLFTSGKAGITFGPTWLCYWPLNEVEANVPGAKFFPYPLPAGPEGKIGQRSEGSHYWVFLMNKDFKDPEVFFTYQNYLYDNFNNPTVGGEFEYGFAKGYDYEIVDGKAVYDDKLIPGGIIDVQKYFLTIPPRTPSMLIKTLAKLAEGKAAETPFEKKNAGATKQNLEAAKVVLSQNQFTLENLFNGKPTETMNEKMSNLQKMEVEAFSKIIYGKVGLDAFDQFVKDWNAAGGEKITQEVRDWYKAAGGK